jgi:hypothetical protein
MAEDLGALRDWSQASQDEKYAEATRLMALNNGKDYSQRAACRAAHLGHSTFIKYAILQPILKPCPLLTPRCTRIRDRVALGGSAAASTGGRPSGSTDIFTEEELTAMDAEIFILDAGVQSLTDKTFPRYILKKLQEKARKAHSNVTAVKLPTTEVMRRLMRRLCPRILDNARTMSRRRIHVLNDPFTQISLAALWPAIVAGEDLGDDDGAHRILPENTHNTDSTSILLKKITEQRRRRARMGKDSAQALKPVKRSPGTAPTETEDDASKSRTVHLLTTISASGHLRCTIVSMKDRRFKKLVMRKVPLLFSRQFDLRT